MQRVLNIGLGLIVLIAAAAAGVAIFISQFDLNRLKPQIQHVVYSSSNIALAIDGPIDWVFDWRGLPSLSISIGETRAYLDTSLEQLANMPRGEASAAPFGTIRQFALGVSLGELLKGRIKADELSIDGLALQLVKDKTGKGNWAAIGAAEDAVDANSRTSTVEQNDSGETDHASFSLNALTLDTLRLNAIDIHFHDQQSAQNQIIQIKQLRGKNVNLQGEPFSISSAIELNGKQQQDKHKQTGFALDLDTELALSGFLLSKYDADQASAPRQITASDIEGEFQLLNDQSGENASSAFTINGNAVYRLQDQALLLDAFTLSSEFSTVALTLNALPTNAAGSETALDIIGSIDIAIDNIQQQLNALGQSAIDTADTQALQSFKLTADIGGKIAKQTQLSLAKIDGQLDNSRITGAASVLIQENRQPTVSTRLNIDAIDLDRYLPSERQLAQTAATAPEQHASSPADLPLEQMDAANLLATVSIAKLIANGYLFSDVTTIVEIDNGDLQQAKLNGKFYAATIAVDASLKRKNQTTPILKVKQTLNDLDIAALIEASLKDSGNSKVLSGKANTQSDLIMQGSNIDAWKNSIQGRTAFSLSDGIYHSDNIEHRVCQAVALARNTRLDSDWPRETRLNNVAANIRWQNGIGTLTALNAGLHNIDLSGTGTVNLPTSRYLLHLQAIITGAKVETQSEADQNNTERTEHKGTLADPACAINEKYNDIQWPIICRGAFSDSSATAGGCEIDRKAINALLAAAAKKEVKRAVEKEVDKALGDKLDGGIKDLIKGGLEGLFK